jgi:hypothetical protein
MMNYCYDNNIDPNRGFFFDSPTKTAFCNPKLAMTPFIDK